MYLLLGTPFFVYGVYYLYKNYKTNNEYIELKNEDLTHYIYKEQGYVCLACNIDDINYEIKSIIINRIKENIIPNYLACKLEKTKYYNKLKESKMNIENIMDEIMLHGYTPKNLKDMIVKTYESKLLISFNINIENNTFWICWNHAVIDGIRITDILLNILDKNNIEKSKLYLIQNRWYHTLFGIFKLIFNFDRNFLKHDAIKSDIDDITYTFDLPIKIIKEKQIQENSSFMCAYQALILEKFKGSLDNVNIVTLIGSSNKNNDFNNYGIIPYNINLNTNDNNLSKTILDKLKNNYYIALLTSNSYIRCLTRQYFKNSVDVMISGCPVSNSLLIINKKVITHCYGYVPYHLIPIYIFSCKINDTLHVSVEVNNKKIADHLKQYNWKILS